VGADRLSPGLGVLDEPYLGKPAQQSSHTQREGESRKRGSGSALSAGAYTTTWLVRVTESPPVAVAKQDV
jgi:hypothetical protein